MLKKWIKSDQVVPASSAPHSPPPRQLTRMMVISFALSFFGWGILCSADAVADQTATVAATSANPSLGVGIQDKSSWKGVKVRIRVNLQDIHTLNDPTTGYFAPAESVFRVVSDGIDLPTPTTKLYIVFEEDDAKSKVLGKAQATASSPSAQTEVREGVEYVIDKGAIEKIDHVLRAWTTGVLVVPYKYGIANHSLTQGSISIGPYVGRTWDLGSVIWTMPVVAGIAKVSVPSTQNGAATSTDKTGLTIATGLLANFGGKINTGILLGVDQLGPNSGYKDNGKLWLGIYVGAGF